MTPLEDDPGLLQVYAFEMSAGTWGTCVVRCVGGVVRRGDVLFLGQEAAPRLVFTLEKIERYANVVVEAFDPPHAARVTLLGEGVQDLRRGDILVVSSSDGGRALLSE